MDQLFTFKNFVHACSGATGGITAISVFYPLNSVRTRLQVSNNEKIQSAFQVILKTIREDGWQALYQGWWSQVVSLGASNFVYFYTYNALKTMYKKYLIKQGSKYGNIDPVTNLMIASVAGTINVLVTTPLWVVGTRLTVQRKQQASSSTRKPYKGVFDGLTRIASEEGIQALWNGVGPSLILVSNPSIQFMSYEMLRKRMVVRAKARGSSITALEFFIMGAIAKAIATVVTYPLQIAQSRLRAARRKKSSAAASDDDEPTDTVDCLTKLYRKHGFRGWYRGMEAKLWQTVLTAAFQFLTYEQISALVFRLMLPSEKPPQPATK